MNIAGAFARFFLPYQLEWLRDPARFKIGLWARQTGKDYTCAAEAVFHCFNRPHSRWLIIACGERQARESLQKAKEWAELVAFNLRQISGAEYPWYQCSATEIRWRNGSRLTALPARPGTIRGYSANVILTEFAFHEDPEGIWRAVFPSVTNPLRGGEKMLRIITTPNGQGNFFHRLWLGGEPFSRHLVTIHHAVAAGLPLDLRTLRQGILEPEAWAQEYECAFTDQHSVLLPYELIEAAETSAAAESSSPADLAERAGDYFVGIDFGRRHDLTVCWVLERSRSGAGEWQFITREVLVLERMPTPAQFEQLRPRVALARCACVDYTGAGVGLGDLLVREFGEGRITGAAPGEWDGGKIELCSFTSALKEELFPRLRSALEQRMLGLPASREIREDLHSIHRISSASGHLRYECSRSADGHGDRATALALALRAALCGPQTRGASSVGEGFSISRGRIC